MYSLKISVIHLVGSPRRADEPASFCRRYPPNVKHTAEGAINLLFRPTLLLSAAGQRNNQPEQNCIVAGPYRSRCGMLNSVECPIIKEISMSTNLEVLEVAVLKLSPADRSHLLGRLFASLDSDPEVEEAWGREGDQREAELASGSVNAVSGHQAIARLRARVSR